MFLNPWYSTEQAAAAKAAAKEELVAVTANGDPDSGLGSKDEAMNPSSSSSASSSGSSPPLPPRGESLGAASVPLVQEETTVFVEGPVTTTVSAQEQADQLYQLQNSLPPNWTVHATDEGRFYYCK